MIEYKDYAKFENLSELSEAIEIGLDIEFILYGERYNISWRDDEPFICRCQKVRLISIQMPRQCLINIK